MSEEQLKAFLEKVKGDTNLQEQLKSAGSNEAAIEIAKDAGFSITSEDIQTMQSAPGEVSDEELEEAAGGDRGCYRSVPSWRVSRGAPFRC
jgi:predicted ribosomally synthesized peptide with nif11-like leader